MEQRPIITLTTDFGYRDPFAGIMKGVILNINPLAMIVDITHEISQQNVAEAAFTIGASFQYFPHKTIHVAVVDPGVGSGRRPILVSTDYHYFVGPDNGIFSAVYTSSETLEVIHVTAEHYFLPQGSSTFHGRDIFSPVAAWLSKGINISKFGDQITDYVTIPMPVPSSLPKNSIEGEVIHIDHFGNLITNISAQKLTDFHRTNPQGKLKIMVKGKEAPFRNYYAEVQDKSLYALINSLGYLELFVKNGSASSSFDVKVGEKIAVIPA